MHRPAVPVVLTVVLLLATACAAQPTAGGTAGTASQSGDPTYPPHRKANVAPFAVASIRTLPEDAAVGIAYPFDLYAHCGIDLVRFGDASWRAEQPYGDGLPGYIAGTMELLDEDTARFVIDQRHFASRVEVVVYHRTAEKVPVCD